MEQAKAKLSAAQEAYILAKTNYDSAVSVGNSIAVKLQEATVALQNAQKAYNESSIPDPTWERPLKEETYTVQVPYTAEVPYVVQETTTSQVARTVQVPHVTTVIESIQVPREVTTVIPSGLTAESYNMQGYNNAPPLPGADRLVATQNVPNIDFNWGGGLVLNSGRSEDVAVRFTGNINIPITGTYTLYAPGDDGIQVIIGGNRVINDWYDKGGGGSVVTVQLNEGIYPFTLWFYENGGGANVWFYWITPGGPGWEVVPASAFGEQTQTTIVYDTVETQREVTTYTEEVIYDTVETIIDVTYYREETFYREEERIRMVPDEDVEHPTIKDPALLPQVTAAEVVVSDLTVQQAQNNSIIESTSQDVVIKQQELNVAQQELEAIPPFREPTPTPSETKGTTQEPTKNVVDETPTPEPSTTPEVQPEPELRVEEAVSEIANLVEVAPEKLTEAQVEQLVEAALVVFKTATQGSPEYQQALEALAVAAEADDPELPAELASIPGAAVVLEAFNNLGNVGADMSPQIREQAEKTVIASVIAAQAAIGAVGAATSAASAAASASSSGGGTSRRNN